MSDRPPTQGRRRSWNRPDPWFWTFASTWAVCAVLSAIVFGALIYVDARSVNPSTRETVTVLRVLETNQRLECGARGGMRDAVDVLMRSENPPTGQPAEFWWRACPGLVTRGETLEVIRTTDPEETVRIAPPATLLGVLAASLGIGAGFGLVCAVFLKRVR